jgi:CubicO group peptidase (beta-lactamase class C family)
MIGRSVVDKDIVMKARFGCIALLCTANAWAATAPIDERLARIERDLRPAVSLEGGARWTLAERMTHYGVPGVSIAIIDDGRIVATRAYGLADRQAGTAMRTDTLMQAASISKAV